MIDEYDELTQKSGPPPWLWPTILVVLSLAIGWLSNSLFSPSAPPPAEAMVEVEAQEEDTGEPAPPRSDQERLQDAQTEVENLKALLETREEELQRFENQEIKDEARRAAAAVRWKAMETEIAQLQERLLEAETERDELLVELKATLQDLDEQIKKTEDAKQVARHYKRQSVQNLWSAFSAEAKVKICDRGSRRRHQKCHEAVELALSTAIQDRFQECVNTYQATPLMLRTEKDEDLPMFAQALSDENRFTKKGWYIQFCDPTLPEAGDPIEDL